LSKNKSKNKTAIQENASNTVRASHISVQRVKKARQSVSLLSQKSIQLVEKTLALVKHSIQRPKRRGYSFALCFDEMLHCGLVALIKNLYEFPYALVGFPVSFSEKRAASQKNTQLFKIAFNRVSACQASKLSTRQFSRVSFIPGRGDRLGRF
jgi:hypothetical protein